MRLSRHRTRSALAVAGVTALLVAACGGDDDSSDASGPDTEPAGDTDVDDATEEEPAGEQVTLVLQTFQDFGYDAALEEFERLHPNITVDHQRMGELRDFAPQLAQWLAAGSGAGDVVGLEEGILLGYIENPDAFHNLLELGADELDGVYLDWKWDRGITADGQLIALGTDVGGLAMCYRADLFEAAGLPSDRDDVAALWPTWDDYLAAGQQFRDSGVDAYWLDGAAGIPQPYVMQNSDVFFYSPDGEFIGDTNPVFREAWDFAVQLHEEDLTAGLTLWTEDWTAAFERSEFATRPCPSWMTGLIENWSGPDHAGLWDITTIPGGGGNWGGSYLGIPAQTEHPQEAYELAKFLTSPEGHLFAFDEVGAMPSSVAALEDPSFTSSTSGYFRDAPVGQIMAESVAGLEPIHLGALHQETWENIFEQALNRVDAGQQSSDDAFDQAVSEAQALQ
ncbi:extracellular solute-binding protein [Phytoactinopolyspora limicola]|uniref:ABC transporter substrate-binding protein n=1 Tax=Phytoactinopolyspora limicola TaxID=2715536 RepID=UPI00140D746F|nr:extracellular solute-binding protein [Phytoactinopolyspora limicola]